MERIKQVNVICNKNGREHVMRSFKTIKSALEYFGDYTHRYWNFACHVGKYMEKYPCDHYRRTISRNMSNDELIMGKKKPFYDVPDFWYQTKELNENKLMREMYINIIRK